MIGTGLSRFPPTGRKKKVGQLMSLWSFKKLMHFGKNNIFTQFLDNLVSGTEHLGNLVLLIFEDRKLAVAVWLYLLAICMAITYYFDQL